MQWFSYQDFKVLFAAFDTQTRTAVELLRPVEQVAVGGVHLVARGADVAFDHAVHHRIEVAHPCELDGLVVVARRAHVFFEDEAHHARLDALAVEFGRDAEDDAENAVAGLADLQASAASE